MEPENSSLRYLLEVAEEVVTAASKLFVSRQSQRPTWSSKADRDPVSEVDLEIENLIRTHLAQAVPKIPFVGEETGGLIPTSGRCWVLDPIDGTVNYLQGSPLCGISLGLIENRRAALGVVDLPFFNETFTGGRGISALRNGSPIYCKAPEKLEECVIAVGDYSVGSGSSTKNHEKLKLHAHLADHAYRVRMLGSAAIDLVWTAAGNHGACVALSNNPWDMTAGVAIAEAANVIVVGQDSLPHSVDSKIVVASGSQSVISEILRSIN